MKDFISTIKNYNNQTGLIGACLIVCFVISACSNDIEKVKFFDRKELPSQKIEGSLISRTESGLLQMSLTAPIIEQYTTPERKTVYPKGFSITFFENGGTPKASISAKHGISYDSRDIMEAKDSVVVIDYRSGDTSYLHDLVWNSAEHRIYTEHPLRSVNGGRVTYGDGLESDDNFNHPIILRQRGTIEWNEED